jgi:hypothetical protein
VVTVVRREAVSRRWRERIWCSLENQRKRKIEGCGGGKWWRADQMWVDEVEALGNKIE